MILQTADSIARPLTADGVPRDLFVIENVALERMLFDRNAIGSEFAALCLEATRHFLQHIRAELEGCGSLSELVILSKGLTYRIHQAYLEVADRSLPMNLIATRRASVDGAAVNVETLYERLDAGGSTLVIGDTVASGATIVSALAAYAQRRRLQSVYVMSYAGSLVGARRISAFCEERSIGVKYLYGLAAFGLAANGFDLSFLDEATITRDEYRRRAAEQFGGRPVSAVGWDFGSQVMAPDKYRQLCWMEAEKWGLHGHPSLSLELEPSDQGLIAGESAAWK